MNPAVAQHNILSDFKNKLDVKIWVLLQIPSLAVQTL